MTRLLITGAGGRIGLRLRERSGDAVSVVSPRSASSGPSVVVADITDPERMATIVAEHRPTAIIHLASVTAAACDTDPELAAAVNVDAARILAKLASEHGVQRFVLASTSAVYGDQYRSPINETGELVLGSSYARTKRLAELAVSAVADASNMTTVALRIFNVYGPGMSESLPNRLVAGHDEAPVTLFGLDDFVRDHVHVDDVIDALLAAADRPMPTPSTIINVGSGRPTTNRALVEAVQAVSYTLADPRSSYSCADLTVASQLLGFAPSRSLSRSSVV